jgi:lipopolysaccharide transport system ATP-binding protein
MMSRGDGANGASRNSEGASANEFWALRDVSFNVDRGEVVGIIGRNGAGKSTLLKILSRITKPTSGHAEIHGRVGSLLEVGTGFHPELTGRENIFLNAAILGMRKTEVERKFDEIVAFAEIDRFIDTPVKRYSSGMYVRLAFAVAAHMDTEILLVDEVLAVGDAAFQAKCLGKIGDVARTGRTIVFVSHNMAAVNNLCTSAILLSNGRIAAAGNTGSIVNSYFQLGERSREDQSDLESFRVSWATPWITGARVLDTDGLERSAFPLGSDVVIEMTFSGKDGARLRTPVMGVVLNHPTIGNVANVNTRMTKFFGEPQVNSGVFSCTLKALPFLQGTYTVDVWLADGPDNLDCIAGFLRFTIEESDVYGTGILPFSHAGVAFLLPEWELIPDRGEKPALREQL